MIHAPLLKAAQILVYLLRDWVSFCIESACSQYTDLVPGFRNSQVILWWFNHSVVGFPVELMSPYIAKLQCWKFRKISLTSIDCRTETPPVVWFPFDKYTVWVSIIIFSYNGQILVRFCNILHLSVYSSFEWLHNKFRHLASSHRKNKNKSPQITVSTERPLGAKGWSNITFSAN